VEGAVVGFSVGKVVEGCVDELSVGCKVGKCDEGGVDDCIDDCKDNGSEFVDGLLVG